MNKFQVDFFFELKCIQEKCINIMLSRISCYSKVEDILTDVTYETIYSIMELLDGYQNRDLKYELIEKNSGEVITDKLDLHNLCEECLKSTDK